jgi:hypothetical protein
MITWAPPAAVVIGGAKEAEAAAEMIAMETMPATEAMATAKAASMAAAKATMATAKAASMAATTTATMPAATAATDQD